MSTFPAVVLCVNLALAQNIITFFATWQKSHYFILWVYVGFIL